MQKIISTVIVIAFSFMSSGCASIVGQSVFPVTINSNPSGAKVTVKDDKGKDIHSGTTPTTITLAAGESYFHAKSYYMTFSKAGFADQQTVLKAGMSGWYWGNLLFGGLIGMLVVDPITGKMWKLKPDVTVDLSQKTALKLDQRNLQMLVLNQVPQEMRHNLIPIN